jgi:hypothetical protein
MAEQPKYTIMMKRFLLLPLLLLTVLTLSAQSKSSFKIGLMAGMSTPDVAPGDFISIGDEGEDLVLQLENANYGFHAGLMMRAQFGRFFIQPEFLLNSSSVDYRVQDNRFANPVEAIRRESFQYLDIPLLLGLKFGPLRMQGGPVGHLFLNSTSDLVDIEGFEARFQEMTYGWQAGLGLDIWKLFIEVNYEGNFSRYGDHITLFGTDFDFQQSPSRIVASVGYTF